MPPAPDEPEAGGQAKIEQLLDRGDVYGLGALVTGFGVVGLRSLRQTRPGSFLDSDACKARRCLPELLDVLGSDEIPNPPGDVGMQASASRLP
jgi:hypothetical protein